MLRNTGERLILEQSWNIMTTLEHLHRYQVASKLVDGKTVLDAACGTGYGTYRLSKSAKEVFGIDISNDAIDYAKEHFQNPNLHYQTMSIADLQFDDETFDVITSFETIEHVTKELQIQFLHGIKKKLKKDGVLIISTPNDQLLRDLSYGGYHNEFHLCEFTETEYIEFLNQFFKYVKIYYQTVTEVSAMVRKGISEGSGPIFSMADENNVGRYYVAICSDYPISESWTLESALLPELSTYFDEAYYTKECMLFVDTGNGFCDEGKIISKYVSRDNHTFECSFSLEDYSNIKALRFDLCEHGGKIKIETVQTNKGPLSLVPVNSNGIEEGYDVFMTLDPQYVSQSGNDLEGILTVTITGKMNLIPDYIVITQKELDYQQLNAQLQETIAYYENKQQQLLKTVSEYQNNEQKLKEYILNCQNTEQQLHEAIFKCQSNEQMLQETILKCQGNEQTLQETILNYQNNEQTLLESNKKLAETIQNLDFANRQIIDINNQLEEKRNALQTQLIQLERLVIQKENDSREQYALMVQHLRTINSRIEGLLTVDIKPEECCIDFQDVIKKIDILDQNYSRLKDKANKDYIENQHLLLQLNEIKNSFSWKVTSPFRSLRQKLCAIKK